MSTAVEAPLTTFAHGLSSARRLEPEKKIHRVGAFYPWRRTPESLASAVASLLTAHHRLANPGRGAVVRFDLWWILDRIYGSPTDPWAVAVGTVRGGSVPLSGGGLGLTPRHVYVIPESADELAQAVVTLGPVVLWAPWPAHFGETSTEYGVQWVGPSGRAATGPWYAEERRAVLVKGVSYRYRALRLQDDHESGREDLWVSFAAVDALLRAGANALGASF